MRRTTVRLLTALASTAVGLGGLWLYWRWQHRSSLTLHRIGASDGRVLSVPASPPLTAPARAAPALFDVESPRLPSSSFQRTPLSPEEVARWFTLDPRCEYDRYSYFRKRANIDHDNPWPEHPLGSWSMRTNSTGFRNDAELLAAPDLRVIVTGDSHTDGACSNDESLCHHTENSLRAALGERSVEVLNAGVGGYSFLNYLGTLERVLVLEPDVFVVCVYGGNDFSDTVFFHHLFNGTTCPEGATAYKDEVDAALAISPELLGQTFYSLKYFARHPDQQEVAVLAAADVMTEIQVTCLRAGVQLVCVYIPPHTDVQPTLLSEKVEAVRAALRLSEADMHSTDRMASAFLTGLRGRGVEVVDLREPFRASAEPLYWSTDSHINLAGQRAVATALESRIRALVPRESKRVRTLPGSTFARNPASRAALASPGWAGGLADSASPPVRERTMRSTSSVARRYLDASAVAARFPLAEKHEWDPQCYFRLRSHLDLAVANGEPWRFRTNSFGLRNDEDPAVQRPDLRVLFAGDEQLEGACTNPETIPARVQSILALNAVGRTIECLNAGTSGHSFYNYWGTLERFLRLEPHVVTVLVNAGTDFYEVLAPWHEFLDRPPPAPEAQAWWPQVESARRRDPQSVAQYLLALKYFRELPAERQVALRAAAAILAEIDRDCRTHAIDFVVVLLPAALDVDRAALGDRVESARRELALDEADLDLLAHMRRELAAFLVKSKIQTIDLGERRIAGAKPIFGTSDAQLTTAGRAWVAAAVAEWLSQRGELVPR